VLLAACLGTILALASGSVTGGVPGHRLGVGFVPPSAAPNHLSLASSSFPSAGSHCRGIWQASRMLVGSSMAGCGQGYPPATLPASFAASLQGLRLRQLGVHHGEAAADSGVRASATARRGAFGGIAARRRASSLQLRMTASAEDRKAGFLGVGPAQGGWGISVGIEDEEERLPEDDNFLRGSLPNGLRYSIKVLAPVIHLPPSSLPPAWMSRFLPYDLHKWQCGLCPHHDQDVEERGGGEGRERERRREGEREREEDI